MAHQLQLEKERYRQWVKAGLGLGYLKEGLASFCDVVAKKQHKDILNNIKITKQLQAVACGQCALRTLKPDHKKSGNNQCPLGQAHCNCCNTINKIACPNEICGAIYDSIVKNHGSTPPAPNWKNTQTQQWTGDPWSIAKCFINAPGYGQNTSAADTDCAGLLHVIINNMYFHNEIACNITGTDVFSKVMQYRNTIFHSSSMELEQSNANSYIDDMIAILEDDKELCRLKDSQDAAGKLKELKKDDFIITTKSEADVVKAAMQSVGDTIEEYGKKIQERLENVPTTKDVGDKIREELENVITKKDVDEKFREKLEKIPTTKDVDDKLREKLQNVTTTKYVDDKLQERLENVPTTKDVDDKLREHLVNIPTRDKFDGLETRVKVLELDMAKMKEEMKQLKTAQSFQRDQYNYIMSKLEFQKQMMSDYRQSLLQVSAIPLKPERKHCNFSEVYVRPKMTYETKDENRRPKETEIQSMSEFFKKAGDRLTSIYVLGEAGSGKSSFCRSLIDSWCVAHSEDQIIEDECDGIKEMKTFEFLFYIALRRYKDVVSIQEMLSKQYKSEILNEILNKESRNIVILLDGLDEWSCRTVTSNQFQTEGLPERNISNEYTVITTSRPWKIETLGIADQEIELRVNLKGFDESSVNTMIDKTVPILNATFAGNKSPSDCKDELKMKTVASLIEVPIMLLQLICLWFDDKLQVSSRCAVYSAILELFFSWNDKKKNEEVGERLFRKMEEMSKHLPNVELPQYLKNNKLCKLQKYLIYELSRLAYKTLFRREKEASLTFDSSAFEEVQISDEVKTSCLKLGILSEDLCPSLFAGTSDSSLFSFVHKSVQEYLAAVYIAIKIKSNIGPYLLAHPEHPIFAGHCARLIKEVFSTCTTLEDILEQANVFLLLCGLEPGISSSISMYIHDIATTNKRVLEYRQTVDDTYGHVGLILTILKCILNCIEEVQALRTNLLSNIYVADMIVDVSLLRESDFNHLLYKAIDKEYISPDAVRSFRMRSYEAETYMYLNVVFRYLLKCKRLENIHIDTSKVKYSDDDFKSICKVTSQNTSTLKSLYLRFNRNDDMESKCKKIVYSLLDMSNIVALHIQGFTIPHESFIVLCAFLSSRSHLKQISIIDTHCDTRCELSNYSELSRYTMPSEDSMLSTDILFGRSWDQHQVDLSKHQQLQCLEYEYSVDVTQVNTSNLNIFKYQSLNNTNYVRVFDILGRANKLTKLELRYDTNDSSKHTSYFVTGNMISLLPLLHQLQELTLANFTFTDNIMKSPSKMERMTIIYLHAFRMSLTTWRQFVDSLPLMPLPIKVKTWLMCITRDEKECKRPGIDWLGEGGEDAAACRYVREQKVLFNVENEGTRRIVFSTRK